MEEESKAIQEVAKTTGKAIDATREFAGFIACFIKGSLEQGLGIFEDKLKYLRWERQIRLMERAHNFLSERSMKGPTREIPMSFAIPLFQAASMEENDYLQDRWAALLVNAADAASDIEIRRSYISILEDLSSLDALILDKIYYASTRAGKEDVYTWHLPDEAVVDDPADNLQPSPEVQISLSNLHRLGCLTSGGGYFGPPSGLDLSRVELTALGKAFVEACTATRQRGH